MNKLTDLVLSYIGSCLPFPEQILKLNGRDFRIIRELGEGGFSKVYLIRDVNSHQLYTIKKVYIIKGEEELAQITFKEIDLLRSFQSEGIIKVLDVQVQQVGDGSRIIYIFLPYYEKGTLQDLIASIANKTREPLSESEILQIFLSLSKTVKFLHNYELPRVEVNHSPLKMRPPSLDITQEDSILLEDESVQHEQQSVSSPTADISPYAHKDLKPGNVLLDESDSPILIDFGSCEKARINVKNSHQALTEQEKAEKYSTILFRAPELFDVQPGSKLDEKVDIWSLGCILYNMAYLKSPFEFGATEHGGSIALSVMNGKFYIPSNSSYSKGFNKLIKQILITEVDKRPDIDQVIQLTNELLNQDS